ncbi:MAG: hypothetical protein H7Z10_14555 [Gemmatimonadaceae bacterium]|nr:hypothetical protein [Acetobacteraceae bacterium]
MRLSILLTAALLAGCAQDPIRIAEGPRDVGRIAPRTSGVRAPGPIPVSTEGTTRPHVVLENMTATARQITVFGRVPTNADVDNDLRKRAAELDADAVVNVRYGQKGVGMVSWNQISGEGQAIRYR